MNGLTRDGMRPNQSHEIKLSGANGDRETMIGDHTGVHPYYSTTLYTNNIGTVYRTCRPELLDYCINTTVPDSTKAEGSSIVDEPGED